MAKEDEKVEVVELVEYDSAETPRFRDALLGIRSIADIKALLTNDEYDPHVHMLLLLFCTFVVGAISFAVGA
jgi:hypothetical protein